jgi:hypothetical protein
MTNKFIINEEEKSEILKKHTDFKKILKEELSNLNRGLVSEQFNTGVVKDPLLSAAEKANCISNGKQIQLQGKPPGYFKVATVDRQGRYSIGDKLVIYNDYTYEVFPKDGSTRKKFTWACPQINQDAEAQAAAVKKAEEDKKRAEQEGMTKKQKEFTDGLVAQGFVIDPSPWDITSKRLRKYDNSKIPGLLDIFKNGLNVYYDPTKIQTSDNTEYTQRAASMSKDVNSCKDLVEKFWADYQEGGEGNLEDSLFYKLRTDVQSCVNKWYPKWDGLEGGALGIGTGQNHLNNIIDVLTGKKTEYKGSQIPPRTTGYLLTPPRKTR